jgi:hypothetical protein
VHTELETIKAVQTTQGEMLHTHGQMLRSQGEMLQKILDRLPPR